MLVQQNIAGMFTLALLMKTLYQVSLQEIHMTRAISCVHLCLEERYDRGLHISLLFQKQATKQRIVGSAREIEMSTSQPDSLPFQAPPLSAAI